MTMTILNFVYLAIIEVFIIDLSGAIDHLIKPLIKKLLHIKPNTNITLPLIDCSLCVVFHTGWIYLLIVDDFTLLNLMITTLISYLTPNIRGFLIFLKEALVKIELILYKLIN